MAEPVQQTLIIIKPDGLKKSLTGNILTKLSETRLVIIGARVVKVSRELAEEHYKQLKDKPFFEDLILYIQGKRHNCERVLALVYQGPGAISLVRSIAGATNPEEAEPTSIRGAYGRITTKGVYENVIHASSSPEEAEREIKLWFRPEEIVLPIFPSKPISRKDCHFLEWA
ncbi:MAG: nucleoside-diphosphate kinase [Candidatus Yanofskybacteria bacterium RIFCSPLOWO2_01_FULL_49_17]|uniref:nucleoside-diphosphate kinase n=1 Tax=Candidatus Yanofskybacteria bacterium RIFCSPLOWO2_01_FULL_49_17 TaxID=1802700 RepID=A0A1F8GS02_9BACT|nr:MAG: nucleoside-diphosphate kinase [Candidatus Yanofskybacteria bacterium RIFCSPLOWO2_01_FULL_49_17]OGR82160.1 MAG: nucleoside-diphosphate kinase [Elusimicrobia bacterium RIFCSPHIGHO2_01_FULL_64_10]